MTSWSEGTRTLLTGVRRGQRHGAVVMQPRAGFRRRSDVTTFHGLGLLAAILGVAATCAGCSDDPFTALSPGPHAAPTRAADCDDLPALGGDPGILLGTDWSAEHHDYRDRVVVYACVSPSIGGDVALVADGSGIQIRPRVVRVDRSGSGVIPFQVTVSKDASGRLRVQQQVGSGGGDLPGPTVSADGDGWHFVRSGS